MVLYGAGSTPSPSPSSGISGDAAAAFNEFLQGLQGPTTAAGRVYMGVGYADITPRQGGQLTPLEEKQLIRSRGPQYLSLEEAYARYNDFSGKQLRDFINKGQMAGQLPEGAGFMEGYGLWQKLVNASAGLTAAGRDLSPFDVLSGYLGQGELATGQPGDRDWKVQYRGGRKFLVNTLTGEVRYQGPQFETVYQRSIDLTDPTTAKAIATSVFQQLMHRDPGKGELGAFSEALRSAEQQSPVVTNITTEYDPITGESIGTSSEQTGGLTSEARGYIAEQQIKKSKEYGATQAATYYGPALERAIFGNPYGSL